jgi:hypothetical protein
LIKENLGRARKGMESDFVRTWSWKSKISCRIRAKEVVNWLKIQRGVEKALKCESFCLKLRFTVFFVYNYNFYADFRASPAFRLIY